jgi:hypothetical protein
MIESEFKFFCSVIENYKRNIQVVVDGMKSNTIYNDDLPKLINQWINMLGDDLNDEFSDLNMIKDDVTNLYNEYNKLKEVETIDNINKELFEIAFKYVEKGYSGEDLRYGDDLYDKTSEERDECLDYYDEIEENGTNWAYTLLKRFE